MNQAKIEKVDNGYTLQLMSLVTTQLGKPPEAVVESLVFTDFNQVIEHLTKENKK